MQKRSIMHRVVVRNLSVMHHINGFRSGSNDLILETSTCTNTTSTSNTSYLNKTNEKEIHHGSVGGGNMRVMHK